MDDEQFNLDLRKFLKRFGVNAQREIEEAVRRGHESGALDGKSIVKVRARLEFDGLEGGLEIEEDLHVG